MLTSEPAAAATSPKRSRPTRASPEHGRQNRRTDAVALGGLLFLVAVIMWSRFWHRPGLADWDIMNFYLPWYAHLGESIRSFDIPGWNPAIFSGIPFAADPQSGWTYLPAMVLFTMLPPITAYKMFFAFHLALGGISAYLLARLLRFGPVGSLAAGCAFVFNQNLGATRCCTNHLQLIVWIPVGMIGIELMRHAPRFSGRFAALLLTGFAISQMIAGWVGQGAYNGSLILGAYLVWRTLSPGSISPQSFASRARWLIPYGIFVFGTGVGLAAAGLLPRLDAIRRTFLGTDAYQGADFAPNLGWNWSHIFNVLAQFHLSWHPYYLGGAVLVCGLLAIALKRRDQEIGFFIVLAIVLVTLPGHPTPLHRLIYLLPRFRGLHLHDPGRVLAVLPIATAMLVATTVDAASRPAPRRFRSLLAIAIVAGIIVALARGRTGPLAAITLISSGAALVVLLIWITSGWFRIESPRRLISTLAPAVLILLVLADPAGRVIADDLSAHSGDGQLWTAIARSASDQDPGGAGAFLQAQRDTGELFRYFGYLNPQGSAFQAHEHYMLPGVLPLLGNNRAMRLGLNDIQGYDPAQIERYRELFATLNGVSRDYHEALVYATGFGSPILDILNVRYILVPAVIPPDRTDLQYLVNRYPEVFRNGEVRVLENSQALPRAWLVHDAQQTGTDQALALLATNGIDPRQTALMERLPPGMQQPNPGAQESVTVTNYANDRVRITVTAETSGMLILSDVYDPGWRVYVDGRSAELYQVDVALRGVAVPPGTHRIEFRYNPPVLQIGLAISSATAAFCAIIIAGFVWDTRKSIRGASARPVRERRRSPRGKAIAAATIRSP